MVRPRGTNKPRPVWAYPGDVSGLENRYYYSLKDKIKTFKWHGSSVNWMSGKKWITELFITFSKEEGFVLTNDFSNFDANVLGFIIRDAFKILSNLFHFSQREEKEWDFIVQYFIHTPLAFYGKVVQKHRGIPSGSCFTSLVDTICDMIVSQYFASCVGGKIDYTRPRWLGDDSRIFGVFPIYTCELMKDQFAVSAAQLGMKADPASAECVSWFVESDNQCGFLSRKLKKTYPKITFDVEKFKAQLLIPESNDKYPWQVLNRVIGLTYAYGFNRECYRLLLRVYEYMVSTYNCKPFMMNVIF